METLKLEVDLKELYKLTEFIAQYSKDLQTKLAIEEIFVNIVNYSNADYAIVNVECDENLEMEFVDNGIQFNPLLKKDTETPESLEEVKIGGLGIMLVKNYADDLTYKYENGENHFKIIKNVK
ncbi:MAG: ATP-binding protein [Methanobrevibacter sp.]|uniref:ATP-binding protein n=1 Tax=Methanobrevibacter sp. TaxID=66852 RepID=UPI001B084820|nr:ATP-binding protein [Methanobrevibacter sp.]MBO5152006.1 ATP-binding protein [Methanobrevibacter sp.]